MSRQIQIAVGLGLAFLLLYGLTSCRTIYLGDSGELVVAAHNLGIPHPPGYPLYCLAGRVFSILPLGAAAMRLSLFSALCGAISVALLFSLAARLSDTVAAALAATFFGLTTLLWSQSAVAEVYTPHLTLFLASLLCLTNSRSRRALCAGAYLAALSLLSHPTSVVLLPLLAYRAFRTREAFLPATLLFLIGLSMVLYLPIRSALDPVIDWGNPEGPRALGAHLLRTQYADIVHPDRTFVFFLRELAAMGKVLMVNNLLPALLPFSIIGLFVLLRSNVRAGIGLLSGFALLFPALVLYLAFPLAPERIEENSVFFLPALALIHIFLACGFGAAFSLAARRRPLRLLLLLSLMLLLIFRLSGQFPLHRYDRVRLPETYARQLLESLPQGAYLQVTGDDLVFPLFYLRAVERFRNDVTIHNPDGALFNKIKPDLPLPSHRFSSYGQSGLAPRGLLYASPGNQLVPVRLNAPLDPEETWRVIVSSEPLRTLWINYLETLARAEAAAGSTSGQAARHRLQALRLSTPSCSLTGRSGLEYAELSLLADSGEHERAMKGLQERISSGAADLESRLLLGELLLDAGRRREAVAWADPGEHAAPPLLVRAGLLHLLAGEREKGTDLMKRAADADKDDPRPLEYLQRIEERREAWEEVISLGVKALEIDPLLDGVRLRIARAYHGQGNDDAARKEFGRLVRSRTRGDAAREARAWFEENNLPLPVSPGR